MNKTSLARCGLSLRVIGVLAGIFMLAACASTPVAPMAGLDAAKQAISNAERAEAGRYAAGELTEARTQLASADTAVAEKKMISAGRFAEESRTEADLAAAKATAVKAKMVNDEMARSTATLVQEMQRAGDKQ